jgi:hypothetical protein
MARTATWHGHLDVLQWCSKRIFLCAVPIAVNAMLHGHLEIIKWLFTTDRIQYKIKIVNVAARIGNYIIFRWLYKKFYKNVGVVSDEDLVSDAAYGGSVQILEFLLSQGGELTKHVFSEAVAGDQIEMMKYLVAKRCPATKVAMADSVFVGGIDFVKCLRENGYMLNEIMCISACVLKNGLDILKYMRDSSIHGADICNWDHLECCKIAARCDRLDTLKWLYTQGTIDAASMKSIFSRALGHLDIMSWLVEMGAVVDDQIYIISGLTGNLSMMLWAKEHGCKLTHEVYLRGMKNAYSQDADDIILFLQENIPPGVEPYNPELSDSDEEYWSESDYDSDFEHDHDCEHHHCSDSFHINLIACSFKYHDCQPE